jgi:hypothetical protein
MIKTNRNTCNPKDPTCCRVPQCSVTGTVGQGTSGFNPAGFTGSFTGYGKPPSLTGSGSQISQTGYSSMYMYIEYLFYLYLCYTS